MEDLENKRKINSKSKKSRLIVRNLSFRTKEDDIKNLFSPYGNIVDISLPKKENGQIKGFAFLSFDNVRSSLKAIKYINGKKHLNRLLAVDFSVPKNLYTQFQENQVNQEDRDNKNENEYDKRDNDNEFDCKMSDDNNNDSIKRKKNRKFESDVTEGKTVFIRNLDFETEESDLKNLFTSFGNVEYCKICYDKYSGKSKGSAFVKFKKVEDTQKCLDEAEIPENIKLYLDGKQLIVTNALSKHQLEKLRDSQNWKQKDKRNLYLAKEGLIYPDSPAAIGVSQSDLKKRLMLEEKKRTLLQNLHYFISDKRLCIHNLPSNYDDNKLKKLFLNAARDKNAKILWAKVMRNRNKTDKTFSHSKGFGFVEFNDHIYALNALRYLNNNPNVFTADRRPIVEFSIENKVALNRKKYRLLKQEKLKNINNQSKNSLTFDSQLIDVYNQNEGKRYSGVETKPFDKNEKVIRPRINRKILEQQKKLKSRNKKLKLIDKTKMMSGAKRQMEVKMKEQQQKKKNKIVEADEFETRYLEKKRKINFITKNDNVKMDQPVNKKRKWYLQK